MGKNELLDASRKIQSRRSGSIINQTAFILIFVWVGGCGSFPHLVILQDPLTSEEHVTLGRSYASQGKTDLALEQYSAALKRQKGFVPALEAMGDLFASQGRMSEAERAYQRVLLKDPDRPRVLNNLGWIYSIQGVKMEKAERLIQRAIRIDPDHKAYYLDTLGGLYIQMKQFEKAEAVLNEALGASPPDLQLESSLEEKIEALKARNKSLSHTAPSSREEPIRHDPK